MHQVCRLRPWLKMGAQREPREGEQKQMALNGMQVTCVGLRLRKGSTVCVCVFVQLQDETSRVLAAM